MSAFGEIRRGYRVLYALGDGGSGSSVLMNGSRCWHRKVGREMEGDTAEMDRNPEN
jgi:hypothetical protein